MHTQFGVSYDKVVSFHAAPHTSSQLYRIGMFCVYMTFKGPGVGIAHATPLAHMLLGVAMLDGDVALHGGFTGEALPTLAALVPENVRHERCLSRGKKNILSSYRQVFLKQNQDQH